MRRRRRRGSMQAPESLGGVLSRAGEDRFARRRSPIDRRVWLEAVGARIADRAEPLSLERGVLVVRAATSTWANELSLLSATLVERLRAAGVSVHELRFRVGTIHPPSHPPAPRITREVPAPAALTGDLAKAVDAIADDELREVVETAARANLAWQAHVQPEVRQRSAASRSKPSKR